MLPRLTLGSATSPDGAPVTLSREGADLVIRVAGQALMSSRQHGSEEAMAAAGCAGLRAAASARVLIGGLGMGYTLRATLDALGPDAGVEVAELLPAVIDWNRGPLAALAGAPLEDRRVAVIARDVAAVLAEARSRYDAILLDVDNGPGAVTTAGNDQLYGRAGLQRCWQALKPGGRLVVWSAHDDAAFVEALRRQGFAAEVRPVSARGGPGKRGKGGRHWLFVARR